MPLFECFGTGKHPDLVLLLRPYTFASLYSCIVEGGIDSSEGLGPSCGAEEQLSEKADKSIEIPFAKLANGSSRKEENRSGRFYAATMDKFYGPQATHTHTSQGTRRVGNNPWMSAFGKEKHRDKDLVWAVWLVVVRDGLVIYSLNHSHYFVLRTTRAALMLPNA